MTPQVVKFQSAGAERFACGRGDALVIVDVQKDFLPGGALAVPGGEGVLAPLNGFLDAFSRLGLPIFAMRDWHPRNHCSFRGQGGPWPAHCVAATSGARFAETLRLPSRAVVVSKGTDPVRDACSGFDGTDLEARLRQTGVSRLFLGGLPTEYCVRATALGALVRGLSVCVIEDGVRALDARAGRRALDELAEKGAVLLRSEAVAA